MLLNAKKDKSIRLVLYSFFVVKLYTMKFNTQWSLSA